MATTVTTKGQVTIPKEIRDALKILPGSKVEFEATSGGEAILRKVRLEEPRPDRFDRAIGSAQVRWSGTTDKYMELIRGYSDDPR